MRIALDIMGGDNAPSEIIAGGLLAAREFPDCEIVMVGTEEALSAAREKPQNVSFIPCTTVMGMDEPVDNLLSKKDSSIWIATKLVKDKEADAVVSAGSTGAQMTAAVLLLGRVKGCARPAIGTILPTLQGGRILLDVGANPEVTAEMLMQFAAMGSIYSQVVLKTKTPRVALLSNGTEECKGTQTVISAHRLLAQSSLNFIGNKEGRDLLVGDYDVLVCDGFSGNIAIKSIEGTAQVMFSMIKEEISQNLVRKAGAFLVWSGLKNIKLKLDYAETGGAPLLGVNGISIICHGSSNAQAIKNAAKVAISCHEGGFAKKISEAFTG